MINDQHLQLILTKNIEWLDIQDCTGLTKFSLPVISSICTNLEVLYFSGNLIPDRQTEPNAKITDYFFKLRTCHINQAILGVLSFFDTIWSLEGFKTLYIDGGKYESYDEFQNNLMKLVESFDTRFVSLPPNKKANKYFENLAENEGAAGRNSLGMFYVHFSLNNPIQVSFTIKNHNNGISTFLKIQINSMLV